MTRPFVLDFTQIDRTDVALVGGKGANLGELSRIEGVRVPAGFCVTTDAFRRVMADAAIDDLLEDLSRLKPDDHDAIRALSAEARHAIERIAVPDEVAVAITRFLARLGEQAPCAVRSSATAEDLPAASFAGQHDTYLNVSGPAIVQHVTRCWASLYTERAVTYRLRNNVDHRKVSMAVVVQRMVSAHASGVLFTADPVTGNRKLVAIEAIAGLGEDLVAGLVNADAFTVRAGEIVARTVRQDQPVLTDAQLTRLAQLGRRIEAHFGRPQDIEWCLDEDDFQFVQSRPITTLFPIPLAGDNENHVYVSVGHQQMMTDPIKPLGLSVWQMTTPRPMAEAGGRLFVDVTQALASPASRGALVGLLGKSDPLIADALQTILDRGDFVRSLPDAGPAWAPPGAGAAAIATDPAVVTDLIAGSQTSIDAARREIQTKSGAALLDFIAADIQERRRVESDPRNMQVVMAGFEAAWWLNDHLQAWLGEKNAADTLTQSVPNNVTSEMGLALLDVADVIRPHPEVVEFLQRVENDDFLDELPRVAGGREARDAIRGWLDKYGMRGAGEIDITRPRWSERPTMLLPLILGNVKNFEAGAGKRRFEQGRLEAKKKEEDLLARLRALPDGEHKAEETKRMIDRVRAFAGYREYPKYGLVSRYFVYKQALMREAERLVQSGVLREEDDIFYLRMEELRDVLRTNKVDQELVLRRKEEFRTYQALTPPRVLTSDGECISGSYRRADVPAGALVGLAVSAGVVEGRARVIFDPAEAAFEQGDILVTRFTDPSWTPLFLSITGLVTEVGGLTTHGAVIAREYGLPAVVGVEDATRLIGDGQRIRVDGTSGHVQLLS